MRLFSRLASGICLLVLVGTCPSVRADIIYNNLGPGGTFDSSGFVLSGPSNISLGTEIDQATAFTVGATGYNVTSISVGLFVVGDLPYDGRGPIDVVLREDAGGVPGNDLVTISKNANTFGDSLFTVSVPGLVQLLANTTYWVSLEPKGSFGGAFEKNSTGATGPTAGRSNNGAWNLHQDMISFALEVQGRPLASVPEPASVLSLAVGVLGLLGYRQLRRRTA